MTKLVAVRVALAWATNVQKMLSDARRFKKALNYVETNVVAFRMCVMSDPIIYCKLLFI